MGYPSDDGHMPDSGTMKKSDPETISFDILLRARGADKIPDIKTIDEFKPSPEHIEMCRRWLDSKGITCHATEFGLACSAAASLFEKIFSTKVQRKRTAPGKPVWQCSPPPKAPPELDEYIDQISVTAPPELF